MASRDLCNRINPKVAIAPVVVSDNTAQKSGAIDTAGFESVTFIIETGPIADVDATFAVVIKDGDTSTQSAHAAVDATFLIGSNTLASFDFAADNACRKIGYVGGKRYVSIEITPTNNASAAPLAAICVLGDAKSNPTANPPN